MGGRCSLALGLTALLALVIPLVSAGSAQDDGVSSSGISNSQIVALEAKLAESAAAKSKTRKRRALKGVVREASSLLRSAPSAPERWRVLNIVLQSQKRLVVIENTAGTRAALLETCGELAKAPDDFADLRLEADLLLSERRLSLENADVEKRAEALAALIARYRDTPGEAKSLMMASQIAPKLEAFDLEIRILRAMQERFAHDHAVIEFRRKSLAAGRIEALFRGSFERVDGVELRFPFDRLGHPQLCVFWSKSTPGFDVALKTINAHRETHPDRFDFCSFNLDELPDAGESTLRALGLDWTVLRLPGGRKSQTFRTYGRREPVSILVNAYGYTLLTPTNTYAHGRDGTVEPYAIDGVRITDERYLAQLQSLFTGEFLLERSSVAASGGLPGALRAIDELFVPAPLRYRLTRKEVGANYSRAARLCAEVIATNPEDPSLWRVRQRRIIALIGMWKTSGEPKFLEEAVAESRVALGGPLPEGADVIPRFALAKAAIRAEDRSAVSILSELIEAMGGSDAPALAIAAATVLALDANSRELHHHYRDRLLEKHAEDSRVWSVVTFVRDRYHTLDLLKVKLSRPERRIRARYGDVVSPRAHAIDHGVETRIDRLPDITLKTLDGEDLSLPKDAEGKLTLLLFVEPPTDPAADFPVRLDGKGRPTKSDYIRQVMAYALERAELHIHKEVEVIAAFLCDDADRVRKLMARNEWPCRAALVPGGLGSPMVRQLGILSADRVPNVFVLRRDGTIAWHTSGFVYKSDFGFPFLIRLAMKVHIEVCDAEVAYKALAAGKFEEAKRVFSGPFLLEKDERYKWRAPRFHGRALANMGLEDWEAALADIDTAIEAHGQEFDHVRSGPCESELTLHRTRARILGKLGRQEEAKSAREAAAASPASYPGSPYADFHGKLERVNKAAPK